MEIHIQLAGVELGPYSEKQVRDYLAEGLLSSSDPARFEGNATWEAVSDVLGKLNKHSVPEPAPPAKIPPATVTPTELPPSQPAANPTTSLPNTTVRKSSLIASTTPLPKTNRDTIRVPLPQLAKALAKQTTQAIKLGAAEAAPVPAPPVATEPPARPASTNTAPLPAKPSDLARTSLLSAVKILAKKSSQDLKTDPKEQAPAVVPVTISQTSDSLRTMPMAIGKSLARKPEPGDKPLSASPASKSPELPQNAPKALDKKQTTLLSTVNALAQKADTDDKPMTNVRALSATRSPDISAAPIKPGETKQVPPPATVRALPKGSELTEKATPPSAPPTTSIPAPLKSPQTLRTAPMSMVRALPRKEGSDTKNAPATSLVAPASSLSESPATPAEAVRFVPAEVAPETGATTKAPPVAPETVLNKKTLRRTTGSLPSLVQAMNKKPEEPGAAPQEESPKVEPTLEAPLETATEEKAKQPDTLLVSWIKSVAAKFSSKKSEPEEVTAPESTPEVAEARDATAKSVDKTDAAEKVPGPARKTIKLLRRTPDAPSSSPEPAAKLSDAPEVIQTPLGPVSKRLPPAQKPMGSIHEATELAKKSAQPAAETVKLSKPPLEPLSKKIELAKKTPRPEDERPALSAKLPPAEKTAASESLDKVIEEPSSEIAETPITKVSKPKRGLLVGAVVALVLAGGIAAGAYYYVAESQRAANALLQALKDGNQEQLVKAIDFPSVRKALTGEATAQVAKVEGQNSDTDAVVSAMIKNSIDYYVTPEAISSLVTKSDKLPRPGNGPTLLPPRAAAILNGFNSLPVKSQGLVSPTLYVIDFDAAKLDLQFTSAGWKLVRVELKTAFQLPQEPGAVAAPVDLGASMVAPVVETYLAEGKDAFEKGDWDAAIVAFSQVLNIDPKQAIAYYDRGMAKSNKGELNGAISDFSQAISLDPKMTEAYFSRGEAKAMQKDVDAAIADYTQAINIDPKMAIAFYKRGTIRTQKGDNEGALADLTQSILLDPNQASAYSNRGFVRQAQHDLDGAIADYTQALSINPKLAQTYYNRGLVRAAKADLDGAVSDYNKALDLDPKMARAYYQRGIAKNTRNDLDAAIADYTQALTLDPKLAPALSDRAVAKQAKGDLKSALADFNQALVLDPKIADAYYGRGLIKEQLGDLDGSMADSSRAIDLDPKRSQGYYNRGFAKLVKGNLEGARADLQKFCELSSRNNFVDSARLYLWLIEMAQNPNGMANQDLSDALQNNWSQTSDDVITKIASYLLDRTTETDLIAAAASPNAKKDAGQHCEIWYFIGMKRLLAGDKVAAIDYFRKCVATGEKDYCEYILAQAELQVLAPNP